MRGGRDKGISLSPLVTIHLLTSLGKVLAVQPLNKGQNRPETIRPKIQRTAIQLHQYSRDKNKGLTPFTSELGEVAVFHILNCLEMLERFPNAGQASPVPDCQDLVLSPRIRIERPIACRVTG